jgi:CHRD domain-containing protein
MKSKMFLSVALISALYSTTTYANTVYQVHLTPSQEVPPRASSAEGHAELTLLSDNETLQVSMSFSNLTTPATAAHIHCCATLGAIAPVVVPFPDFPNTVTGSYSATLLLSNPGVLTNISLNAFMDGLASGLAYVNVHDETYPEGEIRGQVEPVPIPASVWLLGSGVFGLGALRHRSNNLRK